MRTRNRIAGISAAAFGMAAIFVRLATGAAPSPGAASAEAAWKSLLSLQGEWDGTYEGKLPTRVSYRLVSNGTTLMETLVSPESTDMVTMYHRDGDRLVMTHYCSTNNESRMRASAGPNPERIAFSFVDATNLASPDAHHMTALVVTKTDADHFTQEWTSSGHGKSEKSVFAFTRKKE